MRTNCDISSVPFICELCEKPMEESDHDFCDICDDCREDIDF